VQLFNVARCYAARDDHRAMARVAGLANSIADPEVDQDWFGSGVKLAMRNLEAEQNSIVQSSERQWQTAKVALEYSESVLSALNQMVKTIEGAWAKGIEERIANKMGFGPGRLEARNPALSFRYQPWLIGQHEILKNASTLQIELGWSAFDFVKRFGKETEYSNGVITVRVGVGFAALGKEISVDLFHQDPGSLQMTADSWNPEFNVINAVRGLLEMGGMGLAPGLQLFALPLKELLMQQLPWLPAQLDWSILSLEMRARDCIVGFAFGA
jgi:hypothetical protein